MRRILIGLSGFTLLAAAWLGSMSVVLHHPGYERNVAFAVAFALQSLMTVLVTTKSLTALSWRILVGIGALGMIWAGISAVNATVTGPHFEGYVLIIGSALLLQGLFTVGHLITSLPSSSSKVHQVGN